MKRERTSTYFPSGLRIRIHIKVKSWIRIRINVKTEKLQMLKIKPIWTLTMEAWRLKMEPNKPMDAHAYHFDEEQDPGPVPRNNGSGSCYFRH